jgi:hypothetical protein
MKRLARCRQGPRFRGRCGRRRSVARQSTERERSLLSVAEDQHALQSECVLTGRAGVSGSAAGVSLHLDTRLSVCVIQCVSGYTACVSRHGVSNAGGPAAARSLYARWIRGIRRCEAARAAAGPRRRVHVTAACALRHYLRVHTRSAHAMCQYPLCHDTCDINASKTC